MIQYIMCIVHFSFEAKRKMNQKENLLTFRYRCTGRAFVAL